MGGEAKLAEVAITQGYAPGALGRVTELHGTYYSQYWNLGLFFEAKAAIEMADFLKNYDPARESFWLAWQDDKIIGSVTIVGPRGTETSARLRWFILDPAYQGLGVGKTLLKAALDFCRANRFERVYLTTFAGLDSARHLYEQNGFSLY
jgi:GNAT superfamily N-acetyltransferase